MARVLVLQPMIGNGVAYRVGEEVEWPDADVDAVAAAGAVEVLDHAPAPIAATVEQTEVAGRKVRTASTKPRQHR